MKIKQGLSVEEHKKIGKQLKQTTSLITGLVIALEQAYSGESCPAVTAKRIESLLWELRSDLEGYMSREHDSEDTSIYYGREK